jgi:hypothetical protein
MVANWDKGETGLGHGRLESRLVSQVPGVESEIAICGEGSYRHRQVGAAGPQVDGPGTDDDEGAAVRLECGQSVK